MIGIKPRGLHTVIGLAACALIISTVMSCGRYGPPLPPEAYTPATVDNFLASPSPDGIVLTWNTPDKDRQGEDLEELTHYDILRSNTEDLLNFLKDPIVNSEVVGRVYSKNYELLLKRKSEARAKKEPSRMLENPDSFSKFSFADNSLSADATNLGKTFIYSVVPYGREGLPGEVLWFTKITYDGDKSIVEMLSQNALDKPYLLSRSANAVPTPTPSDLVPAPSLTAPTSPLAPDILIPEEGYLSQ